MTINKDMNDLIRLSRFYGEDPEMIQAGGGNTSLKNDSVMWVKASGKMLKDVSGEDDFVAVDLNSVRSILADDILAGLPDNERDARVSEKLLSVKKEDIPVRPSIETFLHALMGEKFVAHTHPLYVNAMVCSVNGKKIAAELFDRSAYAWVPYMKPGYPVAFALDRALSGHYDRFHNVPDVVLMQNHGLIVSGEDFEKITARTEGILRVLRAYFGDLGENECPVDHDEEIGKTAARLREVIIELLPVEPPLLFRSSCPYVDMLSRESLEETACGGALYPDHIVYCGEAPLIIGPRSSRDEITSFVSTFIGRFGYEPKYAVVPGRGVIIIGKNEKEIAVREEMLRIHVKTLLLMLRRTGPLFMADEECRYLAHWEAEKFRQNTAEKGP